MSYRVWWLIAFWALGVGVAIELRSSDGTGKGTPQATARVAPAPVAAQPAAMRRG